MTGHIHSAVRRRTAQIELRLSVIAGRSMSEPQTLITMGLF